MICQPVEPQFVGRLARLHEPGQGTESLLLSVARDYRFGRRTGLGGRCGCDAGGCGQLGGAGREDGFVAATRGGVGVVPLGSGGFGGVSGCG